MTLFNSSDFIWKTRCCLKLKYFLASNFFSKENHMFQFLRAASRARTMESTDHLFLHCRFPYNIWCLLLKKLRHSWVNPRSCKDLCESQFWSSFSSRMKLFGNVAVLAGEFDRKGTAESLRDVRKRV